KIMLIMPIIMPVCSALGISPATVILTYCIADGFTDMVMPTNPVLLIGLSMANVSYGKWIKWTWVLQVLIFILTILVLFFAVSIGY
ncbi:MAG: YfcC family protein, partial [Clostridia bacterium]|nr:YfcC family protein [Clostridia bacterium]